MESGADAAEGAGDFAGDEGFAAARGFVVEEDAVAGKHAVGFAVIEGVPVAGDLGNRVRAAGVKGRGFELRRVGGAEHFRRAGLVEFDGFALGANGFEEA